MIPRIGVSRRPTASNSQPWRGCPAFPLEEHQGRLDAGRGVPTRRGGHCFDSMAFGMAGKCAFPLRRKPRRSKSLVPFQGTREWLGGTPGGWRQADHSVCEAMRVGPVARGCLTDIQDVGMVTDYWERLATEQAPCL